MAIQLDFNNEVVKAAPIVGTAGADGVARLFWGLDLNEWFYVLAILYTAVQILAKLVDTWLRFKKGEPKGYSPKEEVLEDERG
ncbi:holin [Pasteurella phage vB_PmuP_PS07]|nr:holin [Pasteurella phage vB_PmuP_PS07]UIS74056.1 holin [Pasteurella phage vB_PmuP_PS30]